MRAGLSYASLNMKTHFVPKNHPKNQRKLRTDSSGVDRLLPSSDKNVILSMLYCESVLMIGCLTNSYSHPKTEPISKYNSYKRNVKSRYQYVDRK